VWTLEGFASAVIQQAPPPEESLVVSGGTGSIGSGGSWLLAAWAAASMALRFAGESVTPALLAREAVEIVRTSRPDSRS
jgi:hypothetical protein